MLFHRALAERRLHRRQLRQPRHAGAEGRGVAEGRLRHGRRSVVEGAGRGGARAGRAASVHRRGPRRRSGAGAAAASNTLNAMFRFPDVYKVGVAVAPVPDQRLYDTIYQERYMGAAAGQRRGLPARLADQLRRGAEGGAADRARLGRRQRALPGHRAAGQPPGRARQAVRPDGLSRTARTRSPKGRARRRTSIS